MQLNASLRDQKDFFLGECYKRTFSKFENELKKKRGCQGVALFVRGGCIFISRGGVRKRGRRVINCIEVAHRFVQV